MRSGLASDHAPLTLTGLRHSGATQHCTTTLPDVSSPPVDNGQVRVSSHTDKCRAVVPALVHTAAVRSVPIPHARATPLHTRLAPPVTGGMLLQGLLMGALLLLLWLYLKKPAGLPPGRWGLPLLGYIPLTRKSFDDQLLDLQRQYGDIYLWRIGTAVMVFIHDYELSKEALTRPEFNDRPEWANFYLLEKEPLGIGSTSGLRWQNNRRFSMRQLREMGMGKSKLVCAIQDQAVQLVEALKELAGKPTPLSSNFQLAVNNIIWQMVGGKTFVAGDPKIVEFQHIMGSFMAAKSRLVVGDVFSWARYILPNFLYRKLIMLDFLEHMMEQFLTFIFNVIAEHRATLDRDQPRDLIDAYLIEMEDKKDDPDSTCTERDLAFIVLNLFFAGSETTISTMKFFIYYMIKYPHVQKKLQASLDQALPDGSMATLDDKSRLCYLEAVINEVLRMSSLVSIGLQHVATTDSKLGGYFIPKGTILNIVAFSQHHDPRYWDDPHTFLPERWLDADGNFVSKKDGNQTFGVGMRVCPGESLARMELCIFLAAIFQHFTFSAPPGKTITPDPMPGVPLFHVPQEQELVITVRAQ